MTENNAAQAADVLVGYEVYQEDELVASSNSLAHAEHYAEQYSQDGPVELRTSISIPGFHAVESALLSKLRAPVADERVSLRGAANLAFNALHECKPAKGAEKQYSDAIQALQSALHDIAYTVNRTATPQQFADHLQREARAALASAPVAGEADDEEATDAWRRLALQFDGHRMQALGHLRAMLADPRAHAERATEFLAAPPLSGEQELAERIRALAAPHASKAQPNGYAYRYPSIDGSVIRFNNGGEVNGARPIEAIPYWFGSAPQASEAARDADIAASGINVEAAAMTLAECMHYPWAHMPEQGRAQMRIFAHSVVSAALSAQPGAQRTGGSDAE